MYQPPPMGMPPYAYPPMGAPMYPGMMMPPMQPGMMPGMYPGAAMMGGAPPRGPTIVASSTARLTLKNDGSVSSGNSAEREKACTVFVGKIAPSVDDGLLQQILNECGRVSKWKRVKDAEKYAPFGLCTFADEEAVLRALHVLHEFDLGNQQLKVTIDDEAQLHLDSYVRKQKEQLMAKLKNEKTELETKQKEAMEEEALKKEPSPPGEEGAPKRATAADMFGDEDRPKRAEDIDTSPEAVARLYEEQQETRDSAVLEAIQKVVSARDERDNGKDSVTRDIDRFKAGLKGSTSKTEREDRERADRVRRREKEDAERERRQKRREQEDEERYQKQLRDWEDRERRQKAKREKDADHEKEEQLVRQRLRAEAVLASRVDDYASGDEGEESRRRRSPKLTDDQRRSRRKERERERADDDKDAAREAQEAEERRRWEEERLRQEEEEERRRYEKELRRQEALALAEGPRIVAAPAVRERSPASGGGWVVAGVLPAAAAAPMPLPVMANAVPEDAPLPRSPSPTSASRKRKMEDEDASAARIDERLGMAFGGRKKAKVAEWFKDDEDASAAKPKMSALKKIEYTQEELENDIETKKLFAQQALASELKRPLAMVSKDELLKIIIDKIPADREPLFAYPIDWRFVDLTNLVDAKMVPWLKSKMMELLGAEEEDFNNVILKHLRSHGGPMGIVEELKPVLEEDADTFVLKMWRKLAFEMEAALLGVV